MKYTKIYIPVGGHRRDGYAVFHWGKPEKLVTQAKEQTDMFVMNEKELISLLKDAFVASAEGFIFSEFLLSKNL